MPAPVVSALVVYLLLSSGTFLVAKAAVADFDPLALAQLRFLLAGLALLVLAAARGGAAGVRAALAPGDGRWRTFGVLGFLGVALNQGLFLAGMRGTTPAHSALLYAFTPILVVLLAIARGQERWSILRLTGILLAFAGVAHLLLGGGRGFDLALRTGDLLIAAAVVAWALFTVRNREAAPRFGPLTLTLGATLTGGAMFLPIGIPALVAQDWSRVGVAGWSGLLYISLVTSVITYMIWAWALARVEASRVAVVSYLQPIVTALLAWIFRGEPLTLHFAIATAAVLAGVWLAEHGPSTATRN